MNTFQPITLPKDVSKKDFYTHLEQKTITTLKNKGWTQDDIDLHYTEINAELNNQINLWEIVWDHPCIFHTGVPKFKYLLNMISSYCTEIRIKNILNEQDRINEIDKGILYYDI